MRSPSIRPGRCGCSTTCAATSRSSSWLGGTDGLWLVQARAVDGTVARPFAWSRVSPAIFDQGRPHRRYAAEMRGLLANPADAVWERSWRLFRAARDGGDAGALDQVQALAKVPAFAAALLFRIAESEIAEALALEDATAIWWPASPLSTWADAITAEHRRRREALLSAGFDRATSESHLGGGDPEPGRSASRPSARTPGASRCRVRPVGIGRRGARSVSARRNDAFGGGAAGGAP